MEFRRREGGESELMSNGRRSTNGVETIMQMEGGRGVLSCLSEYRRL